NLLRDSNYPFPSQFDYELEYYQIKTIIIENPLSSVEQNSTTISRDEKQFWIKANCPLNINDIIRPHAICEATRNRLQEFFADEIIWIRDPDKPSIYPRSCVPITRGYNAAKKMGIYEVKITRCTDYIINPCLIFSIIKEPDDKAKVDKYESIEYI